MDFDLSMQFFSYKASGELPLSLVRNICHHRNSILTDSMLKWKVSKRKSKPDFVRKRNKAYLHIILQLLYGSDRWHLIPIRKTWYQDNKAIIPDYLSYRTVKDVLDVLVNNDIVIWKKGNKKLDTRGNLKWRVTPEKKYFSDMDYEKLFDSAGFTSEIKLNYDHIMFSKEKEVQSVVNVRNWKTGELLSSVEASHFSQDQLRNLNLITQRWGFHFNNRPIEYRQIFNRREGFGGRFYSDFQNLKREERRVWLPPNFVETDAHASLPNILYTVVTGKKFDGDMYDSVSWGLGIPLEYRSLIKHSFLVCLNTKREKAIKSIRRNLSINGHRFTRTKVEGLTRGQIEDILNSLPTKKGHFKKAIYSQLFALWSRKQIPGKLNDYTKTIEWINRIRNIHLRWCREQGVNPDIKQVLLLENEVLEVLEYVHEPVSKYFYNPRVGQKLVYLESQVLIRVVNECYKFNLPVLTVHDAFFSHGKHAQFILSLLHQSILVISYSLRDTLLSLVSYNRYSYINKPETRTPTLSGEGPLTGYRDKGYRGTVILEV